MKKEGKYIYCIIEGSESLSFGPIGIGGRGDEVSTICLDAVGAVVSNSPLKTYRVSRENMLAHEKAIEAVMKEHTVLPVRFGTIAEDEEKIKKILEKEHDRFADLLGRMNGKKELGLKAIFREDVIYGHILEKYEDINGLKKKIAGLEPEKTHFQRMEIGRKVETALEEEKKICREHILGVLSPCSVEVKTNNVYGECMILNAAFLVENDKEAEFDEKVKELDAEYGQRIKFKYVGTLPPFNFVSLVIETGDY